MRAARTGIFAAQFEGREQLLDCGWVGDGETDGRVIALGIEGEGLVGAAECCVEARVTGSGVENHDVGGAEEQAGGGAISPGGQPEPQHD